MSKYCPPDSWYEPESYEDKPSDVQELVDEAAEHIAAIVKQLYSKKALNKVELESDLETLCHMFGVRFYAEQIQIERKPNNIQDFSRFFRKETENFQQSRRG